MGKLGAHDRAQLMLVAFQSGLATRTEAGPASGYAARGRRGTSIVQHNSRQLADDGRTSTPRDWGW